MALSSTWPFKSSVRRLPAGMVISASVSIAFKSPDSTMFSPAPARSTAACRADQLSMPPSARAAAAIAATPQSHVANNHTAAIAVALIPEAVQGCAFMPVTYRFSRTSLSGCVPIMVSINHPRFCCKVKKLCFIAYALVTVYHTDIAVVYRESSFDPCALSLEQGTDASLLQASACST